MVQRIHVIVQGRVQGVYFRASTRDRARLLRLAGWVRNCPDGSVELIAEGEKEQLEQLITWCREGPPGARVSAVNVEWQEGNNEFAGFVVKY
ncbi:MAG: acylphosphatase [Deltaproteobacteria bacterium]|nr:acylphosphatase [Deltaproteobacteria bacterium]